MSTLIGLSGIDIDPGVSSALRVKGQHDCYFKSHRARYEPCVLYNRIICRQILPALEEQLPESDLSRLNSLFSWSYDFVL
jgi:hypothetical protein